ncbi:S8 family serine peptidase [Nitrosopumilus sp.]|uniref:S8 family serine peptidase n=1 Tax=Nitrosopumilus sp. TaxID=2024843 RepID=UPI00247CC550|nr:S8 family serine peptidase [Nitrosopumilus sp.]MCV0431018.1 S8 family serine peptidase [Nitrosopumilus sp.]
MPKAAIFFFIILISSTLTNSYGFISKESIYEDNLQKSIIFNSDIIDIDEDFFVENGFKRYLIFGNGLSEHDLKKLNSLYQIQSDTGFFSVSVLSEKSAFNLISQGYTVIEDFKLDFHNTDEEFQDASRIGEITGSTLAKKKYNSSGNGTVIAIVDTGVDFSNPDIQHSVARDKNNHPIMLDPDGQGIVLTNATFFAYIDENEIIRNYSKPIPSHMTSSAYVTRDGVFLDVSQDGKGSQIPIYNSFYPQYGNSVIFNGTLAIDMKIGEDNRNYIKSKSGVYHVGIIYQGGLQGQLARIQVVPVLLVDSFTPGVYDTMIPDLSTSWEDYTRFELKSGEKPNYDFDFTDEKPIILGSGKEFLVYDSNDDGKNDYSAGTFGAQVLDVYGVIKNNHTNIDDSLKAINGTLLPGLDPDGEFFGLMTDFMGHGTSSAASITSRGIMPYDIYNDSKKHFITGVAPDAKILPVKALWFGDTVYGWLWSAGFENKDQEWKFSGKPKVDIISNSWGVSNFPTFNASPGMDILSLILSVLTTPNSLDDNYPGVTIISSAGNSGHGYGTIGLPNASPLGISVGATTNNVFVGYGPFKDQPRFGNTTTHSNHIVDFSSRGPGIIGDPKPDIMSIGAHGFTPSNVLKTQKDSKDESFSLFGGTSMAAPIVSGSAAVLIEELKKQSQDYDSFSIKNILMSTATDLYNDPLTQGSGLANIESALDYINGENGVFIVHNDNSYHNIKNILDPAVEKINSTSIGFEKFQLSSRSFPMTSWFAGQLLPGDRTTTTFTIDNPTNDTLTINVKPETLSLMLKSQFNGTTIPKQQDSILNKTDTFIPNYVKLSELGNSTELLTFFNDKNPIPDESSLMVLNVNFDFNDFMNKTSDTYADDLKISSLYLYDWLDNNNDTKITSDEISMVNRAGSWGTVQELRVSEPNDKFEGVPLIGVYPVPTRYSYWLGDTKQNSTSMDYTISASYYQKEKWPLIWSESDTITVKPKTSSTVDVTLITPNDLQTGVYQGFLTFQGDKHKVNAPVSFVIKQPVLENDSTIVIQGTQNDDVLYGNGYTKGAFDMVNRYMAGDWRQYYFDIQNESINTAAIELSWISNDTNLSVFVMNPYGEIIQTNVPSGVFGHFMGWASLDWLGNSIFSQGGGFFPVKNKDDTSTVLYVPINQTGTYTLLTHSTLFGGSSTTEPITLSAKFTNISPEMKIDDVQNEIEIMSIPTTNEKFVIINETKSNTDSITSKSELPFNLGIGIGIVIGIAIGIVLIFIMRQKPPK